jgi:glucose-6-phosphate dehydrogenase assembly protein OpcA
MSTPILALQKPKDISLGEIEAELSGIWLSQSSGGKAAPIATRAATFSMVIYEPEEFQQLLGNLKFYDAAIDGIHGPKTRKAISAAQKTYNLPVTGRVDGDTLAKLREEFAKKTDRDVPNLDARGFSISEAIADRNPCRIITLCPTLGADTGVTAQVSAYCPIQKSGEASNLVCCEYITLRGTKEALARVSEMVTSLLIPDLPKFVWWKATPNPEQELFQQLTQYSNCTIVDSGYFSDPESELGKMYRLMEDEIYISDLNWYRLSPWQELTAAAYDPPERRKALGEVDRVVIDYEQGNTAQAFMFLGWLASRLMWEPVSYKIPTNLRDDGSDLMEIECRRTADDRPILVELAGVPGDVGEIPGDLIGLNMGSTNANADCFTILSSEGAGCRRPESGINNQMCRTEQVTALTDQKAESLMAQQLQRWGRDALYEESLDVTARILKLLKEDGK